LRILDVEKNGNIRISKKRLPNGFGVLVLKILVRLPEVSDEPVVPRISILYITRNIGGEKNKMSNNLCNIGPAQRGPPLAQSRWGFCGKFGSLSPSNCGALLEHQLRGGNHRLQLRKIGPSPGETEVFSSLRDKSKRLELLILVQRYVCNPELKYRLLKCEILRVDRRTSES
jgi:hypothetical protein